MIGAAAEARQDQGAATEASPSAGDTLARLTAACGVTSNVKLDSPIAVGDRELFVDACALQGKRPYMEDRFSIAQEQSGAPLVIGVFDGHGGFQVAQALAETLPLALIRSLRVSGTSEAQVAAAISRCFLEADAAVVRDDAAQRAPNAPGPGSTAAVAVVFSNTIWLCNVGDARAVLADEAGAVIAETADQTPSVPEERARLLMRGATVSTNVYDRKPRACGVLAISRAFGNKGLKQYITADPVVQRVQLPRSGCSLLIASDGLFDVISSAEAVRTLHVRARARCDAGSSCTFAQVRRGQHHSCRGAHRAASCNARAWRHAAGGHAAARATRVGADAAITASWWHAAATSCWQLRQCSCSRNRIRCARSRSLSAHHGQQAQAAAIPRGLACSVRKMQQMNRRS